MSTEFKVSTKIIFWGDQLNPASLLDEMRLDPEFCRQRVFGEEILRKNGKKTGSFAKTSLLSFTYDYQFPDDSRNPEKQFNFILIS